MTKKQRAQVVELLRCAADAPHVAHTPNGMFKASGSLDASRAVESASWDALERTRADFVSGSLDDQYRVELLEAAQRVEEGWTP